MRYTLSSVWAGLLGLALLSGAGCSGAGASSEDPGGQACVVTLALHQAGLREAAELRQQLKAGPPLVQRWGPERVYPGGRLFVVGQRLDGGVGALPRLALRGELVLTTGRALAVDTVLTGSADLAGERAEFVLGEDELRAWGAAPGDSGGFDGEAILQVQLQESGQPEEFRFELQLSLVDSLKPTLHQLSVSSATGEALRVYPEDELSLVADDLLLGGEGRSVVLIEADSEVSEGERAGQRFELPVQATTSRHEGTLRIAADALGIAPGRVRGQASLVVETESGQVWQSEPIEVDVKMQPPVVAGIDPPAASRGQWIDVIGRGFLPPSAAGGTLIRLDGHFVPRGGDERSPIVGELLSADEFVNNGQMRHVFRSQISLEDGDRRLEGLARAPGRFEGTVTPIITWDGSEVEGLPFDQGFEVAPTRQVVYLKYLPGFTVSLKHTFGLKNVERRLRDRILQVCEDAYEGINVAFREERPDDYLEYVVIELGGLDPNGRDLFGLDNTTGPDGDIVKDVGNLRLQEVIGGRNAHAEEQGYLAYGGVFLESFRLFSSWLPEPIELASARFDEILSPMAPFLCGEAVGPDEFPGGERDAEIGLAIHALGGLIGNTVAHEVGHSLGLSLPDGDPYEFHNLVDTPNAMMDRGRDRSFEERAEVDGQGPARFNTANRRYLERVLPLP